ncbi:MAG TPA: hypothetical protein VGQ21_21865 [Thermoanaerobaculia bacterium]|nr:hypothetical protein [Thermoanaerobaculia bacterium]
MRRFLTAFLIAAMTLPSLALMSSAARAACCCNASGSCPLRKHEGCEKSCSMSRSDTPPASSFRVPELARDPAVFPATAFSFAPSSSDLVADVFAIPLHRAMPPALPPPRA